jgi:UDP-glucose 4-epimerase
MRVTVVGGNSFIGSHLVDRLVEVGWEVTVLDMRDRRWSPLPSSVRDIRGAIEDSDALEESLEGASVVFHLAWSSIHEVSNQDPAFDVRANLIPTIQLLAACRTAGVRRIVFASSGGTVYGAATVMPIAEDHPQLPLSAYGINKLAAEKYLHLAHHLHGLEYVVLRPSVAYGPRQSPFARQGAVAVFMHAIAAGQPVTIWGDGSTSRDYFYVTDLVEAFVRSAQVTAAAPGIFNIGGAAEVSLRQLVAKLEIVVGRTAQVVYAPARSFDPPRIVLDTMRARAVLGWHPQTGLDEGLARTWDWMRRNIA